VLRHQGQLLHAWFSAACGGRTTANEDVWPGPPQPYARPVRCDHCRIFPGYHWTAEVPLATLEARLGEVGKSVGELRGVRFTRSQGRVVRARVEGSRQHLELTGNEFRILAGHRTVRSLRFVPHDDPVGEALEGPTAARRGESDEALIRRIISGEARAASGQVLRLEGTGYGHGVGLCQWGARGLAEQGTGYEGILSRYYHGARISRERLEGTGPLLGALAEPSDEGGL
jgi:stage II sporulation protein D